MDGHVRKAGHTRWFISSLLSSMIVLNYFDRVAVSVAAPFIKDSFHLTSTELGIVFSIYTYSYTIMQIPAGSLLDKYGVAWVSRIGMLIWSILTIVMAFLQGKFLLYSIRFLIGGISASAFPAASKATSLWFPPNDRSLPNSLFDAAAKFSNVIGAPLVAVLITRFDWRVAFLMIGLMNVLFTTIFWWYYESPSRHKRISDEELAYIQRNNPTSTEHSGYRLFSILKVLFSNRKVWGLMIGFTGYGYTFNLLLTWLPTFFNEKYHMDILSSGLLTAVPWLIATFSGISIGGFLVDYLVKKGYQTQKIYRMIIIVGLCLGFAFIGAVYTDNVIAGMFCISIGLAGISATAPIGWSIAADIAPTGSISLLSSIVNLANNLFGGILATALTGYLYDKTGTFTASFLVAGGVLIIGLIFYIFVLGDIKQIKVTDKNKA